MRTKYLVKCAQRAPAEQPIENFARAVIADPAAHCATEREAEIIAELLLQLDGAR